MAQESYSNELTCFGPTKDRHVKPRSLHFSNSLGTVPHEVLLIISESLDVLALQALRCTCKVMSSLLQSKEDWQAWIIRFEKRSLEQGRERLLNRLSQLPKRIYEPLLKLIQAEEAIMAGGYVLGALVDKEFKDADIDIFIKLDRYYAMDAMTGHIKSILHQYFKAGELLKENKALTFFENDNSYYFDHIPLVVEIKGSPVKIQFIAVDWTLESSLADFVNDSFDFSFCKCWYDGETLGSHALLDQMKRRGEMNWDNMCFQSMTRKGGLPFSNFCQLVDRRIKKYERRGFSLRNKVVITDKADQFDIPVWLSEPKYTRDFYNTPDYRITRRILSVDMKRGMVLLNSMCIEHCYKYASLIVEKNITVLRFYDKKKLYNSVFLMLRAKMSLEKATDILKLVTIVNKKKD